ncbi:MAG TPA: GNAT family N-acetyltransferase [Thermomicrobiales bacterium]|nr:GNAT family N-acetyltransferase [Thermomicrobiales bacterium]
MTATPALVPDTAPPAPRAIGVEVVDDLAALRPHRARWNALVRHAETSTIFQTFEWLSSWCETLGAGRRLLVLLAWAGGELVGVAPLVRAGRRTVEFIGAGVSDYADFIVPPHADDVRRALGDRLLALRGEWDRLELANVPEGSATPEYLEARCRERGLRVDRRVLYDCPTYRFGDAAADQQLVRKKSLRRHVNYFQRTGRLECAHCETIEEVRGYLDQFFDQHARRRALTDAPSAFLDERQRDFFRRAAEALLPAGWLRFAVVRFDDAPLAFHFGFEYGGRFIWYKPSFDPSYASHSPGEVLLKYLFDDALARGVAEFDFTIGEEAFKYRFANHVRRNEVVRVYRRAPAYFLERLLRDGRARLKRSPALARWGRWARRRVRRRPVGGEGR